MGLRAKRSFFVAAVYTFARRQLMSNGSYCCGTFVHISWSDESEAASPRTRLTRTSILGGAVGAEASPIESACPDKSLLTAGWMTDLLDGPEGTGRHGRPWACVLVVLQSTFNLDVESRRNGRHVALSIDGDEDPTYLAQPPFEDRVATRIAT